MNKIYLDDVRIPLENDWITVKSYDEFTSKINEIGLNQISLISLDHDLGDEAMTEYYTNVKNNFKLDYGNIKEKTGYDCAKFLVEVSLDTGHTLPPINVHSANPIGSANIIGYINNYLKNCNLPQTCSRETIPHKINDSLKLNEEERKKRWDMSK